MVTIYALRDPRTQEVRYIGSTSDATQRKAAHISACRNGRSANRLTSWFRDLSQSGIDPDFVHLDYTTEEERAVVENEYIARYSEKGNLLNLRPAYRPAIISVKARKEERGLLTIYEAAKHLGKPFSTRDVFALVSNGVIKFEKIGGGVTKYVKRSDLDSAETLFTELTKLKKMQEGRDKELEKRIASHQSVNYIWLSANGPDWQIPIPKMPEQYRQQQKTLVPTF